ncbi:ArdC family protein [Priestia megaterium]
MATNLEMITEVAMMAGFNFDGENLKTFQEWKRAGFSVKKGEKATFKLSLWKPFTKKIKDEETGEEKKEQRFKLVPSALFTPEQVQPISEEVLEAEEAEEVQEENAAVIEVTVDLPKTEVVEVKETEASNVVSITIKPEEVTEDDVKKAYFVRKPSTAREVMQSEYKEYDRYTIKEEFVISSKEFYNLCSNLIVDNDLFEDFKGGTFSTTDPTDENETRSFYQLSETEQNQFFKGAYRACVKVSSEGSKFSLIIDPQGYNYARYVAIETH